MATTTQEIRNWLERGKAEGYKWMIVVCDSFDHEDYPVYAKDSEEFWAKYDAHNGKNMQRIMESYCVIKDWDTQLEQYRCNERPTK